MVVSTDLFFQNQVENRFDPGIMIRHDPKFDDKIVKDSGLIIFG